MSDGVLLAGSLALGLVVGHRLRVAARRAAVMQVAPHLTPDLARVAARGGLWLA